jgi:sRNA-binding protein
MGRNAIVAVISLLAEKWPCCFSIPESRRRPLKLGIREDVLASLDGAIPAGKVSAALRWYVSSPEYQRRLVHGAWRVDLNGRPAGTVSEEDEAHARALLFAIQPKPPERTRASSNSEPQRMEQTLQTEQRNVPPAPRLPAKPTTPSEPAKFLAVTKVRAKQMADQAERRLTKKRGQIRAWRAP